MPVFYRGKWINPESTDEWKIAGPSIRSKLDTRIRRFASKPFTVLIAGEQGSGKELIAKAIHERSKRRGKPYVTVNVSALTDTLFESELFGHVKGAFTGATARRTGLIDQATEGTLFLDEIGDLTPEAQAALLRFTQYREKKTVGEDKPYKVDVRLIAATNRDIWEDARQGRFRSDLLDRLDELDLETIPLRHEREDIPDILAHLIKRHEKYFDDEIPNRTVPGHLTTILTELEWWGNVRQLENGVRKFATTGDHFELVPREYRDLLRFLNASKEREWNLGLTLKIVAQGYVEVARSLARQEGINTNNLLMINEKGKRKLTDDPDRNRMEATLNHYPGLQKLFQEYAKRNAPLSYVITRFGRAVLGIEHETALKYPPQISWQLTKNYGETQVTESDFEHLKQNERMRGQIESHPERLIRIMNRKQEFRLSDLYDLPGETRDS